jgi:hypothetical protein
MWLVAIVLDNAGLEYPYLLAESNIHELKLNIKFKMTINYLKQSKQIIPLKWSCISNP